uniref:Uncharacterized protein n=1 Tax=Romanomermis culicivorax TaxID=13658 RepID=A0A915KSF8_ROMCU
EQEALPAPAAVLSTVNFSSLDLESAAFDLQHNSPLLLYSTTDERKLLQATPLKLAGSLDFLSNEEVAALGSKLVDAESKIACCSNQ